MYVPGSSHGSSHVLWVWSRETYESHLPWSLDNCYSVPYSTVFHLLSSGSCRRHPSMLSRVALAVNSFALLDLPREMSEYLLY